MPYYLSQFILSTSHSILQTQIFVCIFFTVCSPYSVNLCTLYSLYLEVWLYLTWVSFPAGTRRSGRSAVKTPSTICPSSGTSSVCWSWWACCRWASFCPSTSQATCWVSPRRTVDYWLWLLAISFSRSTTAIIIQLCLWASLAPAVSVSALGAR